MKNPWAEWEHRFRNLFPNNPTQTNYFRFEKKPDKLPESKFDESVKWFEDFHRQMFITHYNKDMEDINGRT